MCLLGCYVCAEQNNFVNDLNDCVVKVSYQLSAVIIESSKSETFFEQILCYCSCLSDYCALLTVQPGYWNMSWM